MIIGIDLGTTNSAVSYMGPQGPELIPTALGDKLTPSVVGIDEAGVVLVGRSALEYQVLHPERCASIFKRGIGTDRVYQLADRKFTAEELSSLVLKSLKGDAEAYLKEPITRAVITVPAYFNDNQRKATIRAGQLAGLQVERILNEPTAAAIAYGLHDTGTDKVIAVFDLGGGTFDISIVELFEGTVEVRATAGECFLGGEDFTRTMAARILETQKLSFETTELKSPLLVSRLIQQCEKAKRRLSQQAEVEVRVPNAKGEVHDDSPSVTIKAEDFKKWTENLLSQVEMPIRRCMGDARLSRNDIHEVILVGGATRMPAVRDRVTSIFNRMPRCHLNPDEVVAMGAAVQAGLFDNDASLNDLVVTDVCPFTLGIEITKKLGSEQRDGYFMPIITRNSTIPISRVEQVSPIHPQQTEVIVKIFQGESRRTDDSLKLGELAIKSIPIGSANRSIDVRFTYDLNGVLEVEATVVATKKKASLVITNYVKGMSHAEIEKAVAQMESLKSHPREEAVNRFVLRRSERVFRELSLDARTMLGEMLDAFEYLLSQQSPAADIEAMREQLLEFLRLHDPEGEGPDEHTPY